LNGPYFAQCGENKASSDTPLVQPVIILDLVICFRSSTQLFLERAGRKHHVHYSLASHFLCTTALAILCPIYSQNILQYNTILFLKLCSYPFLQEILTTQARQGQCQLLALLRTINL